MRLRQRVNYAGKHHIPLQSIEVRSYQPMHTLTDALRLPILRFRLITISLGTKIVFS